MWLVHNKAIWDIDVAHHACLQLATIIYHNPHHYTDTKHSNVRLPCWLARHVIQASAHRKEQQPQRAVRQCWAHLQWSLSVSSGHLICTECLERIVGNKGMLDKITCPLCHLRSIFGRCIRILLLFPTTRGADSVPIEKRNNIVEQGRQILELMTEGRFEKHDNFSTFYRL